MAKKLLENNRYGQAPKWADMGLGQSPDDPLHQKDVKTVRREELDALPVEDPLLKARWERVKRWLTQEPKEVARGRALEAKMTPDEVRLMVAIGHAEKIAAEDVKSTVHLFPTEEKFKKRRRLIKHSKAFNDAFGKDVLENIKMLRAKDLVRTVHDGRYAVCVDFSAWFDQLELDEAVRDYFCFLHQGQWYRLTRVPMGMRTSVDIAHTATEILASFPRAKGVRCDIYVDNVRFLSDSRKDVVAAAAEFIDRCRRVCATINEVPDDTESAHDAAERLVTTKGEFLGGDFDYTKKQVRVGKKTIAKLVAMRGFH